MPVVADVRQNRPMVLLLRTLVAMPSSHDDEEPTTAAHKVRKRTVKEFARFEGKQRMQTSEVELGLYYDCEATG